MKGREFQKTGVIFGPYFCQRLKWAREALKLFSSVTYSQFKVMDS